MASAGAFVAALVTEIKFKDLSGFESSSIGILSNDILNQNHLYFKTEATAGIVFAITGISIIVGFVALVGRICHIKHTPEAYRIFSCLVNRHFARVLASIYEHSI